MYGAIVRGAVSAAGEARAVGRGSIAKTVATDVVMYIARVVSLLNMVKSF